MRRSYKITTTITFLAAFLAIGFTACNPSTSTKEPEEIPQEELYERVDDSDFENMSALQFTKIMGNGINLGNTMEAAASWLGFNHSDVTDYETAWGQPKTTKAMFQAMKAAGFDSVRIPVAWTHTMDWSHGNFTIRNTYIEHVGDVVNWALDSGLIVMINDHWDYQWWGMFSHDEELAWQIYEAIWGQVGGYFKDYPLTLIFEGGNEEIGERLNDEVNSSIDSRLDSSINYGKGSLTEDQCYALGNKINQKFVDLIRAQGGNNEKRFLLIPGYNTGFEPTCDSRYKMPADSTNEIQKLIVSVHYYSPATYAIVSDPENSWGYMDSWPGTDPTFNTVEKQNSYFEMMKVFTQKGYGVIIGEYGAAPRQDGSKKGGMEEWMTNILDNCDKYNYCPFLWDCNTFFKKNGGTNDAPGGFTDSEIAAVYSGRNYEAERTSSGVQ